MSLSPSLKHASGWRPSGVAVVATPRQLMLRIQSALTLLVADRPAAHLAPQARYRELLLLSARLLFLRLVAEPALLGGPGTPDWKHHGFRRGWAGRIQDAVHRLRFLRATPAGIEPHEFDPQTLGAALNALQGPETVTAHVLGSAFESLLAFHPVLDASGVLQFETTAGNSRKTSGSYYTPDALIQVLLDSAVEPLCQDPLRLKVCDPSCGSGQFLLAAAYRIIQHVPHVSAEVLAEVCGRQLYGVDLNPLAVELCRFQLWIRGASETQVREHVVWGDSLLGTLPGTVRRGLGREAFAPLLGDTSAAAREQYRTYLHRSEEKARPAVPAHLQADAWCAMLMCTAGAPAPPWQRALGLSDVEPPETLKHLEHMVTEHRFLHWHLAFPEVFGPGFDVVLGNPPWERIEVQDKEWFASRVPAIQDAPNAAARKRLIEGLADSAPDLYRMLQDERRRSQTENHFLRVSGRFPLTGKGGINRYAPFTEACRQLIRPGGRVGYVVPSGLVHDENTRVFFQDLMESGSLQQLYHFDNRRKLFPAVGGMITFCLITLGNQQVRQAHASFVCFAQRTEDLSDANRRFTLSAEDLRLLNPNTRTLPIFRSSTDADITRQVYRNVPILLPAGGENPWGLQLSMLFQMSNDSHLFRSARQLESDGWRRHGIEYRRGGERFLPLYEAKMLHQFDHRWASYRDSRASTFQGRKRYDEVEPRYWVPGAEVDRRLRERWTHDWLLVWRDVCRSTDERTVIASILPRVGVGHTAQLMFPTAGPAPLLLANLNSLVLDYIARQKIGGIHLTYSYLQQLPVLSPSAYPASVRSDVLQRAVQLAYTSDALHAFGRDHGAATPFHWDTEARARHRAELDAIYFRLYGLDEGQIEHVLSTFPILRRKEEARYGEYRTGRLIREALHGGLHTTSPASRPKSPKRGATHR